MEHHISLPLTKEKAAALKSGDTVYLSGVLYTARDAAHKRMMALIENQEELPFPIQDAVIYYVGPTPEKPGRIIGSAGPTTSYRMDSYTPALLKLGLKGMIGKGMRSEEVIQAMEETGAVYFGAIGGAGALLSSCIKKCDIIAFKELGPEAVRRLEVEEFPLVVVIDCYGESLYISGKEAYLTSLKE